jgi:hypothetical protein
VRVWRDDSRTVKQIEHDDRLDGIVYPKPIVTKIHARTPAGRSEVTATVEAIAARLKLPRRGTRR